MNPRYLLNPILLLGSGLLSVAHAAEPSALCTSDDRPAPTQLVERFINADCADCWTNPLRPDAATGGTVTLDWIAPGPLEDQGALYAAARVDALARLKALGRKVPSCTEIREQAVQQGPSAEASALRVAHGRAVGNYLGTSIEWRHAPPGHWRAWLLMVEELPAGTAGSPTARQLVRNSLQLDWVVPLAGRQETPTVWSELRPMQIPIGAHADRLRVIGFIELLDPTPPGQAPRLVALSQSRCEGQP